MSSKKPTRRKRRTREHVIADLGVNHLERHALLSGFTVQRVERDYGIDLWISTYDRAGEVEPGEILAQVKATDSLSLIAAGELVTVRIRQEDCRRWLLEPMPVILVLYDARADAAYWLYLQSWFASQPDRDLDRGGATLTLHIPKANVLDQLAVQKFAEFRDAVLAQMKGIHHRE